MKDYIPIRQLLGDLKGKSMDSWFDNLSFLHIFLVWAVVIVMFGFAYRFLTKGANYLYQPLDGRTDLSILDSIYFSFITATTTGFGDILPFGGFRILALIEVVCGLLLLAFVTSKLVSIKQDMILNEIYDISLTEKINRIRSSLLLFRQNITRIIHSVEEGAVKRREISDMYIYISSLEDSLQQVSTIFAKNKLNRFRKEIDPVNTELIFISVVSSMEKILELIIILDNHKIEWRREVTITLIRDSIRQSSLLFEQLGAIKNLPDITIKKLKLQMDIAANDINKLLEPQKKGEEEKKQESGKKMGGAVKEKLDIYTLSPVSPDGSL